MRTLHFPTGATLHVYILPWQTDEHMRECPIDVQVTPADNILQFFIIFIAQVCGEVPARGSRLAITVLADR